MNPSNQTLQNHLEEGLPCKYNYAQVWQWLQQAGKSKYGKRFQLYEGDKPTIYLLLCWFLQDDLAASHLGLDLQKGILLSGPIGCGKTSLMHLMRGIANRENQFTLKSCRDVSFEFIAEGYSVLHKYSRGALYQYLPRCYCFDDLGTESNLKYYGNECNVMAEVLLTRYDLYVAQNLITHLTTNLSASEIETLYGNRVRSRMRAMFNLVAFSQQSIDKR